MILTALQTAIEPPVSTIHHDFDRVSKKIFGVLLQINCKTAMDKQYVDAFVYAIRRHFSNKKLINVARFEKFKKRSYLLLFASLTVVMICHGIVPMILSEDVGFSSDFATGSIFLVGLSCGNPLIN